MKVSGGRAVVEVMAKEGVKKLFVYQVKVILV